MMTVFLCIVVGAIINVGFMEWQSDLLKAIFTKDEKKPFYLPSYVLSVESMFLACLSAFLGWKYSVNGSAFWVAVIACGNLSVQQLAYQTIVQGVPEMVKTLLSKFVNKD